MNEFSERLSSIISELKLKKTAVADRLNVSQAFVSQLCSGVKQPSERTILDICEKFNVNEEWLRTGEGDMFVQVPEEDLYSKAAASLLKEEDVFAMEALKLYHSLSSDQRAVVKNFIMQLAENVKEKE